MFFALAWMILIDDFSSYEHLEKRGGGGGSHVGRHTLTMQVDPIIFTIAFVGSVRFYLPCTPLSSHLLDG